MFASVSRLEGEHSAFAGSHAEYGVTPAGECLPLPDGMDPIQASGLVLTQVGYNGAFRPPVGSDTRAVVIGDGLVGQWAAQGFRARGAEVLVLGRHPRRLELARLHSADAVLNDREVVAAHAILDRWPEGVVGRQAGACQRRLASRSSGTMATRLQRLPPRGRAPHEHPVDAR